MNVVVERSIYARAHAVFDDAARQEGLVFVQIDPLDEARALDAHAEGAEVFIFGTKRYSDEFFQALRPGTLVQRFGVGYNAIPLDLCRSGGIRVGYTPGVLERAVAEHTVALVLSLARGICALDGAVRKGQWERTTGVELRDRAIALIGFGRIAREVARIARQGFGMRVLAFGLRETLDPEGAALVDAYFTDLPSCLASADFVSLHLPSSPQTDAIVNETFLEQMKSTAFLVNTARGSLVDEGALFHALDSRAIAGAALDVFQNEPYTADDHDLRSLDNCVLTPHCASNTEEANRRMASICVRQCVSFYQGQFDELVLVPEL